MLRRCEKHEIYHETEINESVSMSFSNLARSIIQYNIIRLQAVDNAVMDEDFR